MHIEDGFVVREIAGETIAIPSGDAAKSLSGLVSLNESGRFLFELLRTEQTADSLLCAFLAEFDVDESTAREDIEEFLGILRQGGILVED